MDFKIVYNKNKVIGDLFYNKEQYINFIPSINSDISILISYLNIQFSSENMNAKYVWGFIPKQSWLDMKLQTPNYSSGELKIISDCMPGVSYRLDDFNNMWDTYYDSTSRWLCVGDYNLIDTDLAVEFATNTVAILQENKLKSLWLKPEIV